MSARADAFRQKLALKVFAPGFPYAAIVAMESAVAEAVRLFEEREWEFEAELDRWRVTHADDEPSWKHAAEKRALELAEARAEVERLKGERQTILRTVEKQRGELADWKRNGHIYLAEIIRKNEERLTLAEKLAKAIDSYRTRGAINAPETWEQVKLALDAFISSGRGEGEKPAPRGEHKFERYHAEGMWCACGVWRTGDVGGWAYGPIIDGIDPQGPCPLLAHPEPSAQPSKDPDYRIQMTDAQFKEAIERAQADATARLEEENAKLRAFRDAGGPEIRERHRRRNINALDWCSNPECIQKGQHPWPCPTIAALDGTEGK